MVANAKPASCVLDRLSPRERELAGLVADGLKNGDAARRMGLNADTCNSMLHRMYIKLGFDTRLSPRVLLARLIWDAERGGAS